MGLVTPGHVGSSGIRDWTHVSCIGRQILYYWATREALPLFLLFPLFFLPSFLIFRDFFFYRVLFYLENFLWPFLDISTATVSFNWECHDFFFIPKEYFLLGIKFWVDRVISFNTNNILSVSSGLDDKSVVIRIVFPPNGSQNSFLWVQGRYIILVI